MRILQVHNRYQNLTGEEAVVQEEYDLLTSRGHEVIQFTKLNETLDGASFINRIQIAKNLKSSNAIKLEFRALLNSERPDLVHVHNVFPLITPVVFEVSKELSIPTVFTLHNYRLLCVNTLFYRDGHVCEDCLSKTLFEGIKHKCYNNSYVQSILMANAIAFHNKKGTWINDVDVFACMSEFAKTKFINGGIPEKKITVKPNFVAVNNTRTQFEEFFLYAGKLEEQKGLLDFIDLANNTKSINYKVVGHCPNPNLLEEIPNVEYLGQLERYELLELMKDCRAVLFLSKMYEGMPMTILEAFANKKAVVARNLGAMAEMISHGSNGLLFENPEELKEAVLSLSNKKIAMEMGEAAFSSFELKYSPDIAYNNLLNIYQSIL